MKETKYDYVFTHKTEKVKLKFQSTSIEEATIKLGRLVNKVMDWDLKRFKSK
jgi:hypothetical protein